jgi:hypothetical protein
MRLGRTVVLAVALIAAGAAAAEAMSPITDPGGAANGFQPPAMFPITDPGGVKVFPVCCSIRLERIPRPTCGPSLSGEDRDVFPTVDPVGFPLIHG